MARTSPNFFFAQILLEYLRHADSVAAGVPSDAELQKLILDSGELQELPGLVITAAEADGGSTGKRVLHIVFALLYRNRASGVDAAQDTASLARSITTERASQIQDAVESRLMDRKALGDFIAGLPEDRRTGFSIMKWRRLTQPSLKRQDKPTPHMTILQAFEMQVFWSRQSAA